ncbi:MAG: 2-succinyl-5-enolpyruvyl-6-hydroxy-3-cyclohexene-1-carboxylic-acid synthase [Myxococcota bacterium]|nr:2-succinyl-5-enolpyruvyl-6-hydroxy-3-cyclohexene-1-carboxylic-acid synthase [Myxococcota bacterium]
MIPPSNLDWAGALIDVLVAGGARHAVVSPGSRNTPVVLALHRLARQGRVTLHDVLDERSAGFFGLGLARMTGQPVLLSCTSGSAGAHYLPAIVEASHARLPLIALTADRPPELQGVGAPQTTPQADFFAGHVRFRADPGPPDEGTALEEMTALGTRALDEAMGARPGPVHLNLPFRKPLWDDETHGASQPVPTRARRPSPALSPGDLEGLVARTMAATRGVIVCGPGDLGDVGHRRADGSRALQQSVGRLADALGWPVLIDGASSLRAAPEIPGAITVADTLSRAEGLAGALAPDLVLRVGPIPTSTPLRRWLAHHGAGRTVLLDAAGERQDPDHLDAEVIAADPAVTLAALAERVGAEPCRAPTTWRSAWVAAAEAVSRGQSPMLEEGPLWAGSTARILAETLPPGGLLHVASSLAVRALDSFGGAMAADTLVTANRGVNGIDGTLATAFGQATLHAGPTAVLLGDLAFLHDVGSLATLGAHADRGPMVVLVLDNSGGGIFDHLPISEHPTAYEPHFVTPPRADVARLGEALARHFVSATAPADLRETLGIAFSRPGLTVIHVPFTREQDLQQHRRLWAVGQTAIQEVLP